MNEGWIKIYGKIREWEWWEDPFMLALWIHILVAANWRQKKWHGIIIERGQFVTSIESLATSSGLSVQQTRTCLDRLIRSGQITKKSTNKFTIISICNYDSYQTLEDTEQQTNNKQTTNKQQTNNKQTTTTEELKINRREEDKINTPLPPHNERVGFEFFGKYKNVELKPVELRALVMEFGEEETQSAIEDLSCKLLDGTQQSNAHHATLRYWLSCRRKKQRNTEPQRSRDLIGRSEEFTTDDTYTKNKQQ